MGILEMVRALGEFLLVLSAIMTSYAAVRGISAWKDQLIFSKYTGTAEKIMAATYKVSTSFENARLFDEYANYVEKNLEMHFDGMMIYDNDKWQDRAKIFEQFKSRYDNIANCLSDLYAFIPIGEVLFGKEVKEIYKILHDQYSELNGAFEKYTAPLRNELGDHSYPNPPLKAILYSDFDSQQEFKNAIDDQVNKMYELLKSSFSKKLGGNSYEKMSILRRRNSG